MTILFGTDLSPQATEASSLAAVMAKRLGLSLKLVHIIDEFGARLTFESGQDAVYDPERRVIEECAARLSQEFGIVVEALIEAGPAPELLVRLAARVGAKMIIISSLGSSKDNYWLVGSVAEGIAQISTIPLFVIRDKARLESWLNAQSPLRIIVGADIFSPNKATLSWVKSLQNIGPCSLHIIHLAKRIEIKMRFGRSNASGVLEHEAKQALLNDLRKWVGDEVDMSQVKLSIAEGKEGVDAELLAKTSQDDGDLLVIGMHHQSRFEDFWYGSIPRHILQQAACNVACVPRPRAETREDALPRFFRVLVATDLTPAGNRAVPYAFGLVEYGGVVHLLHVMDGSTHIDRPEIVRQLKALTPEKAQERAITSLLEIVSDGPFPQALVQSAASLEVDAICLSTTSFGGEGWHSGNRGRVADALEEIDKPVIFVPVGKSRAELR